MAVLVHHLPMSFAPHMPVLLLVVVRRNRAANADPNSFLVGSSAKSHARAVRSRCARACSSHDRAAHSRCARACRKDLLLAVVELVSSPFATSLLKMMGHRRSSPNAAMVAKLEPPPQRFRRPE